MNSRYAVFALILAFFAPGCSGNNRGMNSVPQEEVEQESGLLTEMPALAARIAISAEDIIADSLRVQGFKFIFVDLKGNILPQEKAPKQIEIKMYRGTTLLREFVASPTDAAVVIKSNQLPPEASAIIGDFNFDGSVGFLDFFILADAFGSDIGDDRWDERVDLDGDKTIGFLDFFIFADNFGAGVSGKAVAFSDGMKEGVYALAFVRYGSENLNILEMLGIIFGPLDSNYQPAGKIASALPIVFRFFGEGFVADAVVVEDFYGSVIVYVRLNFAPKPASDEILYYDIISGEVLEVNLSELFLDDDDHQARRYFGSNLPPSAVIDGDTLRVAPVELEGADFESVISVFDGANQFASRQFKFHRIGITRSIEAQLPLEVYAGEEYAISGILLEHHDGIEYARSPIPDFDRIDGVPSKDNIIMPDEAGTFSVIVGYNGLEAVFELTVLPSLVVTTYSLEISAPAEVSLNTLFTISAQFVTFKDGVEAARESVVLDEGNNVAAFSSEGTQTVTRHYTMDGVMYEAAVQVRVVDNRPLEPMVSIVSASITPQGALTISVSASDERFGIPVGRFDIPLTISVRLTDGTSNSVQISVSSGDNGRTASFIGTFPGFGGNTAGARTVTVTAALVNKGGYSNSVSVDIRQESYTPPPPMPTILSFSPPSEVSVYQGDSITLSFTAQGAINYDWHVNDSPQGVNSTSFSPSTIYVGTFMVKGFAANSVGAVSANWAMHVLNVPQPSITSLTSNKQNYSAGEQAIFTASAINAQRIEWRADGNPGVLGTGASYVHSWSTAGYHTVTATAQSGTGGYAKTDSRNITVSVGGGAP